ncbi:MAG: sigma-70 RNA polymerase sigma factor region 4 domain-containing protein, partial [Planctomycetota bacterium]
LNDPARFRSWAYRIVTNKSRDWIKRRKATKQTDIGELDDRPHKERNDTGLGELLEKLAEPVLF